jgi:hypothetical protein
MLEANKATKAKIELCNFGYDRRAEANAEVIGWILWRPSLCELIISAARSKRALAEIAGRIGHWPNLHSRLLRPMVHLAAGLNMFLALGGRGERHRHGLTEQGFAAIPNRWTGDRRSLMKPRNAVLVVGLLVSLASSMSGVSTNVALGAPPSKPAISEDASSAIARMGATLRATEFSFQVRTIRVSANTAGELLHIGHTFKVTVRRPDRLLVDGTGDDGPRKLIYDGKTAVMILENGKKYASLPVPDTIDGMMRVVIGHFGVDFPLADFLTNAPDKAFLTGVTAGREVGSAIIDGVQCRHLVFSQPPGIELELWPDADDQSLPRRLIVTYRSLPGEPNFIAEFSDWNFNAHPADAEFQFEPPEGAEQLQLDTAPKQPTGAKQ